MSLHISFVLPLFCSVHFLQMPLIALTRAHIIVDDILNENVSSKTDGLMNNNWRGIPDIFDTLRCTLFLSETEEFHHFGFVNLILYENKIGILIFN